jgi:predicted nucleic acid-binding protein
MARVAWSENRVQPRHVIAMPHPIVLDTNIALDLLVFDDAACQPLQAALADGTLHWIGTEPMRVEFARVLGYPLIVARLARMARSASQVLEAFDEQVIRVPVPVPVPDARQPDVPACDDPDDQVFIDLAVVHQAVLVSKDRAVLQLRRSLAACGVAVMPVWVA